MYPLVTLQLIEKYLPLMEKEKVSVVARSKGQFLDQYRKYGKNLPDNWKTKRENFIKRHLAQYQIKPTTRRWLALLAWGYRP